MEEETANRIYSCALALNTPLNELGDAVNPSKDEVECRRLKRAVGDLMGAVYTVM